jgi:hypothetical protein
VEPARACRLLRRMLQDSRTEPRMCAAGAAAELSGGLCAALARRMQVS